MAGGNESAASDDSRDWYAAADAFLLAGGLSETSLTGQLYRDNGVQRAKESHWAASNRRKTMGSSTARLLGVEGRRLSSCACAWPKKIPSVVPERLTGQLHSGVCLKARTSAERAGSHCMS